jgi:hypothetical protein
LAGDDGEIEAWSGLLIRLFDLALRILVQVHESRQLILQKDLKLVPFSHKTVVGFGLFQSGKLGRARFHFLGFFVDEGQDLCAVFCPILNGAEQFDGTNPEILGFLQAIENALFEIPAHVHGANGRGGLGSGGFIEQCDVLCDPNLITQAPKSG